MIYPDKALFSFHLKLPLCFTMKAGELHPCYYFLKFYSKFFSFKEEIILMIKQEKNTYTSSSSQ